MSVLLPDRVLTVEVRAHPWVRDAHGTPVPGGPVTVHGPHPGAAQELPDLTWELRVDAECWPMRAGDKITDDAGLVWVVVGSPVLHRLPGYPYADYVAVKGTLDPPRVP